MPNPKRASNPSFGARKSADLSASKVYLVGGGIAALAAAAFMVRDGGIPGNNITVLEERGTLGGSLDGTSSPHDGYVLRGGRMFESKCLCTYDLFSSIPTLDGNKTVTQEIFGWNEMIYTSSSKGRLVGDGHRQPAPGFGLSERQILTIERLLIEPEIMLGQTSIADQFDPAFFKTNFWFMWCTTFAFQPWHSAIEFKRYLVRFAHLVAGVDRLHGIMRTVYNQYDSMVRPLCKWLVGHGVRFELNTRVTDLGLSGQGVDKTVTRIACERGGQASEIVVGASDYVLVTLGSMTEASSLGNMDEAPRLKGKEVGGAWTLWERIACGRPEFGHPSVFADHIDESKWVSFTTTLYSPAFFRLVLDFTRNVPGEGGVVTFPESNWLASIVIPHQPHFM